MSKIVKIISKDVLEATSTPDLLKRLQHLRECEDEIQWPPGQHAKRQLELESADQIEYKHTKLWEQAFAEVKAILPIREHIPGPEQRQAARKQRALDGKSKEKKRR
jgi:hypothetical protein